MPDPVRVRVRLDRERCCGFTLCTSYAPELFSLDARGIAVLDEERELTPDLVSAARAAATACPQQVITVT